MATPPAQRIKTVAAAVTTAATAAAAAARDTSLCLEPQASFFLLDYFIFTISFTFRTIPMTTNEHATSSMH